MADNQDPKSAQALATAMKIYRFCWITVVVMMLASVLSAGLTAYFDANPTHKLAYYVVAAALIAGSVVMRFRIRKMTGKFPTW